MSDNLRLSRLDPYVTNHREWIAARLSRGDQLVAWAEIAALIAVDSGSVVTIDEAKAVVGQLMPHRIKATNKAGETETDKVHEL